ncbi:MAG: tRNA epoxyqueuosine(34) reductase QueG, partial [Bacteroidales bacterium]|nr:tRNA epoxyqueuosine(34) reductase QueG [Bacteroidales bacterium]
PTLLCMDKADWQQLTREQYTEIFRKSAVKRAKFEGLRRNIDAMEP